MSVMKPFDPSAYELAFKKDQIHVWQGCPVVNEDTIKLNEAYLSAGERERSRRFVLTRDRYFYVIGRGILRRLLGRYLEEDPAGLVIDVNHQGKPHLLTGSNETPLHFNISHSQGMVMMAFSLITELGVDVEYIHRERDYLGVAERYLSVEELSILDSLRQRKRKERFYQFWVKKEALLKLAGEGVFSAAGREEELKKDSFIHEI